MNAADLTARYAKLYPEVLRENVTEAAENALEAVRLCPQLAPALEKWVRGENVPDVIVPTGCSLLETAGALCPERPDVPVACYLLALHASGLAPGIPATAGTTCHADERIFSDGEAVMTAFRTQNRWVFLGETASAEGPGAANYVQADLWQIARRAAGMIPLLLFPLFGEGTLILREGDYYSVNLPAEKHP